MNRVGVENRTIIESQGLSQEALSSQGAILNCASWLLPTVPSTLSLSLYVQNVNLDSVNLKVERLTKPGQVKTLAGQDFFRGSGTAFQILYTTYYLAI